MGSNIAGKVHLIIQRPETSRAGSSVLTETGLIDLEQVELFFKVLREFCFQNSK
jgi:hypothetical protein